MTPTQLRAYAAVVRLGSVKQAAAELGVSESAVSLLVAQLRKELGDKLFTRTSAGLAFTPGGLRLATRSLELLGLQHRTFLEVSQASQGRRLLRVGATSLFAEHAAPGLIDLFARRADDLDVELSIHSTQQLTSALLARVIDVAIGPRPAVLDAPLVSRPFLNYQVVAVAGPEHPDTTRRTGINELRNQTWLLGPSAASDSGVVRAMLRRLAVPEEHQQIFQSHAAALEEAKRNKGIALAVSFAVSSDLAAGALVRLSDPALRTAGVWCAVTLAESGEPSAGSEFARFVGTPRATQAMLRGSGVNLGRFRPSIHVTLWS